MNEKIKMIDRFKWSLNPKKYIFLINDRIKMAFIYILIIASIFGGIQGITVITTLGAIEQVITEAFDEGKLEFKMEKGLLEFKTSPYKEEQGAVLLLIDTDKTVDEVESLRSIVVHKDLSTVILKDGIVVKSGTEESVYKYSDIGLNKFDFDSKMIEKVIKEIGIVKYFLIPIMIIIKFIDIMFYSLVMSLAGMLSILLNKQRISYGNVFKLAMYSITLPTILTIILPIGKYGMFIGGILLIFGINFVILEGKLKE